MARLTFYSFHKIKTYNAMYNGVVGGRGLGKTYGGQKDAIKDAFKFGNHKEDDGLVANRQFILLRRYKEELASARKGFFTAVQREFPDYDFRIHEGVAQATHTIERKPDETDVEFRNRKKTREWVTIGHFIALSQAQHKKGTSYHNVYTIIFDEFIIEKGHLRYLDGEVDAFNNFYNTVDRWEDRVKVFFFANSVSIMNPYFTEWEIEPDQEKEFVVRANGFIVFHFPDSEKFRNEVFSTKFGQFIKETSPEYADYAVGNQFADNHGMLLGTKDYRATYLFSLETSNGPFSVWKSEPIGEIQRETKYYIQRKQPKTPLMFTLLMHKVNEDKPYMSYSNSPLANLRTAFTYGRVMFDDQKTRNTFAEIFDRR